MASTNSDLAVNDVMIELHHIDCMESSCQELHPNINTYTAVVRLAGNLSKIGHVQLHTLNKAIMDTMSASQMMQESQVYDDMHLGAQLHKVENFLENESFVVEKNVQVAEARMIVFVEEARLAQEFRGKGRSLGAVRVALMLLGLPSRSVVLLQAGSTDQSQFDPFEADEKLTRHWAKLGFGVWSDSDSAWLCLSPEDEVLAVAALHDQGTSLAPKDEG